MAPLLFNRKRINSVISERELTMKYDKRQKTKAETAGFTLVEIVAVLVLLGILAAVAVPKFFDLSSDAEKKAAEAALMEAQVRINARYSKYIYLGLSCEDAVKTVSQLSLISDSAENNATDENSGMFNGAFIASDSAISADGTQVKVTPRGSNKTFIYDDLKMKLYVPKCDEDDGNPGGGSSSGGNGGTGGSTGGSSGSSGSGENGGEDSGTTGNCPGSSTGDSSKNCDECQLSGASDDYLKTLRPYIWNAELEEGVDTELNAGNNAVLIKYNNEFYVSLNYVKIKDSKIDENPADYAQRVYNDQGWSRVVKIDVNHITTGACVKCSVGTLYKKNTGEVYVYVYSGWQDEKFGETPENSPSRWMKIQGYRKP